MTPINQAGEQSESTRAGWIVRPARAHDLPSVRLLLESCRLPIEGVEDQFGDRYVVAELGGYAIGVAGIEVHGDHGLLRSVAVSPTERLGGIGAALVRDRVQWAKEVGLKALFLLTTDAARYFHRHGFRAIARDAAPLEIQSSREFAHTCPESARLMRFDDPYATTKGGTR